ncbi:ATP-grasp domain-containing protein [Micromonospora profundi]|uniref:ATP-grasp domain-containing protein n=1 Tax=Micromonospora profundi TaxID=1420889 RepID=UPI003676034F
MTVFKHVLVVAGARDVTPVLRRLNPAVSITTLVATQRLAKVRHPTECARVLALDEAADPQEWVAVAQHVHRRQPIEAVGAFGEFDQDHAAAIASALNLPFHREEVIAAVYDKVAMRRRLSAAGVEEVPSTTVSTVGELRRFADDHGLPVILKPQCGTGSLGIVRVDDLADLDQGLDRAVHSAPPGSPVVVEPFLTGAEVSVEAFSERGEHRIVGITHKIKDDNFVELGHVVREPGPDDSHVVAYVRQVLNAMGITQGPTHTELILTGGGPRVVETHTRAGGDQIPALLAAAAGIDLVELAVRQVLGERVLPRLDALLVAPDRPRRVGAIRYLVPPRSGRLVSVEHTGHAVSLPFVTGCVLLKDPGDELITPIRDSVDRVGYCTSVADDSETAEEAARRAIDTLTVTAGAT